MGSPFRLVAAAARGFDVVDVGVLAYLERPRRLTDHLAVLEHVGARLRVPDAKLVAEGHVLQQLHLAVRLALERAGLAGAAGVDQGGYIVGAVQHDRAGHGLTSSIELQDDNLPRRGKSRLRRTNSYIGLVDIPS